MSEKTTAICREPCRRLEVEFSAMRIWQENKGLLPRQEVSLVLPETPHSQRVRLLSLTPRTALNLLVWLRSEQALLEQLAAEYEAELEAIEKGSEPL